jgi:hypothetical protein
MSSLNTLNSSLNERFEAWFCTSAVRWIALLGLCAAYLQGGLTKALDFDAAAAEMNHFGLAPSCTFTRTDLGAVLMGEHLPLSGNALARFIAA